jgi:hypothetical protein
MLPTVDNPGDFPAVELGDALERLKQEAINQIVSQIMDTFIYKGFTPEQVFDAFAEYIAKKLNNRPAVGLMEEIVQSFQNFDEEVKSYERIAGRRSQVPKSIEDLENPPLESIRLDHESFLSELEAEAVHAIASNDWAAFYNRVGDFQAKQEESDGSPG